MFTSKKSKIKREISLMMGAVLLSYCKNDNTSLRLWSSIVDKEGDIVDDYYWLIKNGHTIPQLRKSFNLLIRKYLNKTRKTAPTPKPKKLSDRNRYLKRMKLPPTASKSDIKKRYHELALHHHPDKGGNAKEFQRLNETYSSLMRSL